jgi:hypothetical protein
MRTKIVALLTLAAFLFFEWSCAIHSTKKYPLADLGKAQTVKAQIAGVVLKSGEEVRFVKPRFGRVLEDFVVAFTQSAPLSKVAIRSEDVQSAIPDERGEVRDIMTKAGKAYQVRSLQKENDRWIVEGFAYDRIIPLAEVELVYIRKVDPAATFLATIGGVAGVVGVVFLIVLLTKESCPFIYSYDGTTYVFDAEPYGGATSEGIKRTEWCGLQYLKEVGGEYRIKITNEVDETQFTDEMKLLVVDHPAGAKAVADEDGRVHTLSDPRPPIRAVDGRGRDILPRVVRNDEIFWITKTWEKNADRKEDLRDELLFEFPKPAGARTAKLLFNGCNTLWASQMVKRFLELYGADVSKTYEALRSPGPARDMRQTFNDREELYRLKIWVETPAGWANKGLVVGGGPFVSEDRIYAVDLADVPGDILRIKLSPPAAFWMINHLAVDYDPDLPVQTREIEAIRAVDFAGRDLRQDLAATDGRYFVMPNTGDWAEIAYPAPARAGGLERTVILKASGYYDIHLRAEGPCRMDILTRFLAEPGFVVQYSFREFLKWQAETLAQLQK